MTRSKGQPQLPIEDKVRVVLADWPAGDLLGRGGRRGPGLEPSGRHALPSAACSIEPGSFIERRA
jgi:hypothetical protein